MSRRPDPQRIRQAHRDGTIQRLIGEGLRPDDARRWVELWEAQDAPEAVEGGGRYWAAGWDWIAAERAQRRT
jgi:hypothetical protein